MVNALTGLGAIGTDKRLSAYHKANPVSPDQAQDWWRGNDIAARIIETVPNEGLRQGFTFKCDDKDLSEKVQTRWEELGVSEFLWRAWTFERAYGGGAGLLGANDGASSLMEPLDIERVSKFDFITSLEPIEVVPFQWYTDPTNPKFGKPSIYTINPISTGGTAATGKTSYVHESRLVIFPGIQVSRRQLSNISGWGDSILTRIEPVLRDFNVTWESAAVLLVDFSQAVFKMKDLAEIVGMDRDEAFKNRMKAVDLGRSVLRAMVIDAEEEFERKSTTLTGLPELLDRFSTRLAAAADMPLTLLMGQSPAGLNATGASDIRFFYDRVKAAQNQKVRPAVEYITRLILNTMGGEPDNWSIEFNPLWQPTDKEKADTRLVQAQADQIYISNGVVSADEVALSRFGGDEYSLETVVDFEARAELEASDPAREENAQSGSNDPEREEEGTFNES